MALNIGTPNAAATPADLANLRTSLGLGSVDNTSDALKPESTAQAAINATITNKRDKPAAVTVTASRSLATGDIGNFLGNASGAYTLTLPTGLGAALDAICLHPPAGSTGTLTLAVAAGVAFVDTTGASLTVAAGGYLLIQCDGTDKWSRAV